MYLKHILLAAAAAGISSASVAKSSKLQARSVDGLSALKATRDNIGSPVVGYVAVPPLAVRKTPRNGDSGDDEEPVADEEEPVADDEEPVADEDSSDRSDGAVGDNIVYNTDDDVSTGGYPNTEEYNANDGDDNASRYTTSQTSQPDDGDEYEGEGEGEEYEGNGRSGTTENPESIDEVNSNVGSVDTMGSDESQNFDVRMNKRDTPDTTPVVSSHAGPTAAGSSHASETGGGTATTHQGSTAKTEDITAEREDDINNSNGRASQGTTSDVEGDGFGNNESNGLNTNEAGSSTGGEETSSGNTGTSAHHASTSNGQGSGTSSKSNGASSDANGNGISMDADSEGSNSKNVDPEETLDGNGRGSETNGNTGTFENGGEGANSDVVNPDETLGSNDSASKTNSKGSDGVDLTETNGGNGRGSNSMDNIGTLGDVDESSNNDGGDPDAAFPSDGSTGSPSDDSKGGFGNPQDDLGSKNETNSGHHSHKHNGTTTAEDGTVLTTPLPAADPASHENGLEGAQNPDDRETVTVTRSVTQKAKTSLLTVYVTASAVDADVISTTKHHTSQAGAATPTAVAPPADVTPPSVSSDLPSV